MNHINTGALEPLPEWAAGTLPSSEGALSYQVFEAIAVVCGISSVRARELWIDTCERVVKRELSERYAGDLLCAYLESWSGAQFSELWKRFHEGSRLLGPNSLMDALGLTTKRKEQ